MKDSLKAYRVEILLVILCAGGLIALIPPDPPTFTSQSNSCRRCKNDLKFVGLGLYLYHEEHGSFPPQFTVDAAGNRLHSWRTLILPHLDHAELHDQMERDSRWDSKANQRCSGEWVSHFVCESTPYSGNVPITTYFAIEESPVWDSSSTTSFDELGDPAKVMVAVACHHLETAWAQPEDVSLKRLVDTLRTAAPLPYPHDNQPPSLHILFADGHVEFLPVDDPRLKLGE